MKKPPQPQDFINAEYISKYATNEAKKFWIPEAGKAMTADEHREFKARHYKEKQDAETEK